MREQSEHTSISTRGSQKTLDKLISALTAVHPQYILREMKILPSPLIFQWDEGNINKNLKKHGVTDSETEETFSNKPLLVSIDKKHSTKDEVRYHALGKTDEGRVLFLTFTVRKRNVRIVSARPPSRKEKNVYAKK